MSLAGSLFLAIAAAYGLTGVALRCRGMRSAWCLVPVVLACPLLIPSASVGLRALSAVISADIVFKLVDVFRRRDRITLRDSWSLLVPFPVFAVVSPDHRRRLPSPEPSWPNVLRILVGIVGIIGAVLTLLVLSNISLVRSSFAINHVLMLLTFVMAIESISIVLWRLEHLLGFDTTPIMRRIYLSRTVSEFWQRYNVRIHDWLYRNVFQPSGGRHAPGRSVLLVFFVSGVFHELMFGIATSRFTGYQLAFFTLQAPAALASGRLERLAKRGGLAGKIIAHGSTILFLAVTSVLFFDGVRTVFPFLSISKSPLP